MSHSNIKFDWEVHFKSRTSSLFQIVLCRLNSNQLDCVYTKSYHEELAICQCKFFLISSVDTSSLASIVCSLLSLNELYFNPFLIEVCSASVGINILHINYIPTPKERGVYCFNLVCLPLTKFVTFFTATIQSS